MSDKRNWEMVMSKAHFVITDCFFYWCKWIRNRLSLNMEKQLAWYCWLLSRIINQRTQKTGHGAKNKTKQKKTKKNKNSSLMVVISKGKQWTSPWATSVELREELV